MPAAAMERPIRPLPALLVNQIAAGEVVERPASVVKELVENSIDAGATRIGVDLESGGIELVRVADDGRGIAPDQLTLALAPHATSKIGAAEDLDRIATLGFRGEALASIASVSRMTLRSRTAGDEGASQIEVEGGAVSAVKPAPGPVGTVLTVRNLFFNTPARRKFLRTPGTEQTRCLDALRALAMANPSVGFRATVEGRVVIDLPAGQSPRDRALAVLGEELASQLVPVHADAMSDDRGIALWGLAGLPVLARATPAEQYVFLNGRVIRDRTIQHALKEAYRGLIEPGRHPAVVLMLEMSPGAVDVNVHPAKAEVRFRDSGLVHSVVLGAVREALRAADLTPTLEAAGPRIAWGGGDGRAVLPTQGQHGAPRGEFPHPDPYPPGGGEGRSYSSAIVDFFSRQVPAAAQGRISYDAVRRAMDEAGPIAPAKTADVESTRPTEPALVEPMRPTARVLQVHKSYLVTQDEEGVVIVDQHALHERVMFEYLIERISRGALESQRLLAPAVVPAAPAWIEGLPALAPLLEKLGIAAEPLGPAAIGVQAFPTFLFDRDVDPVEFMTGLLEKAEAGGFEPGSEAALHEALDMMACKAAVKAGDRLSEMELVDLVGLRDAVERSSNCPHGRPTSVRLTLRELERLFRRT